MKVQLVLDIECGVATCASEPGKFCCWVRTARYGSIYHCGIFESGTPSFKGHPVALEDKDGWLQRHPDCLAAERRGKKEGQ